MFLPHVSALQVFSSADVVQNLTCFSNNSKVNFVKNKPHLKFDTFISEFVSAASIDADLTIFTSNESNDGSKLWNPNLKNAFLLVHNPSFTIHPFSIKLLFVEPLRSPVLVLKMIKTFFSPNRIMRRKNFDQFQNILLADEQVTDFCKMRYSADFESKNTLSAPFYGIERVDNLANDHKVSIIVPGTIENKTRNYNMVIDLIKEVRQDMEIELILLGKIKNIRLVNSISSSLPHNIKLIFKIEGYSQKEYDAILENATFAILPLKKYMRQGSTFEIQGKTCISGSINDVTKFGIPFLYPKEVTIPTALQKVGIPFDKFFDINTMFLPDNGRKKYQVVKDNYNELIPFLEYKRSGIMILEKLIKSLNVGIQP